MKDPLEIPVFAGTPLYSIRVPLDGRDYRLYFDWNDRNARWYLTLSTIDDELLRSGILVLSNWPLLRTVRDSRKPPGQLFAIDLSSSNGMPPGYFDFGSRVRLFYFPV